MIQNPKAFISHSSIDNQMAERLSTDLRAQGVDAWFDEWEIKLGDSLRRKIDEGRAMEHEKEIDRIVGELYGLNEEEMGVIWRAATVMPF